jgi:ABC-type antimicrobial peptide transport system permease subunit
VYAGIAVGLAASLGLGRFLESQVFGVSTADPFTLISVSLMILALALAASVLPIRRATRIEPMVVLRDE